MTHWPFFQKRTLFLYSVGKMRYLARKCDFLAQSGTYDHIKYTSHIRHTYVYCMYMLNLFRHPTYAELILSLRMTI